MNQVVNNIKQRLSLREPLAEALEVVAKLTDKLALKKPAAEERICDFIFPCKFIHNCGNAAVVF